MSVYIGIGSNIEPRKDYIQQSLQVLEATESLEKISPVYETAPLLPENPDESWNLPFLNMVVKIRTEKSPTALLSRLKEIEKKLERQDSERWAPRRIDLDILLWDDETIDLPELNIPHPELSRRAFVLDPLKDLNSNYIAKARELRQHSPLWMGILNLTPDSFSDGGDLEQRDRFLQQVKAFTEAGTHILDLGAESTRPGAKLLGVEEEWQRLEPHLRELRELWSREKLKPLLSVDTYKAKIAERAIELGADIVNDVSGLSDPAMISVLKNSEAQYVLTHSLGVPASPHVTLKGSAVEKVSQWLETQRNFLERNNISADRVFFDPGIGFGKTPLQSLSLLKNLRSFADCPYRILVGHSRKSFLSSFADQEFSTRDPETLGASMALIQQGVDVLRVHNPALHIAAHRGWSHARG